MYIEKIYRKKSSLEDCFVEDSWQCFKWNTFILNIITYYLFRSTLFGIFRYFLQNRNYKYYLQFQYGIYFLAA